MFCKSCGKQLGDSAKFCTGCGIKTASKVVVHKQILARSKSYKGLLILVGALVLVVIIILSFVTNTGSISKNTNIRDDNTKAVVDILCDNNKGGSGTIFTNDGTILTNNHVIAGALSCKITIPNPSTGGISEVYEAAPVIASGLSKKYDVATLKINSAYTDSDGKVWGIYPREFPTFVLPSTCNVSVASKLGDFVRVYGYPVTSGGYNLTITDGVVSSFSDDGDILTSAQIDSGNSGGLAIDQNGCWLGIPSAVVSGNYQNLGVIIPGNVVKAFLDNVPAKLSPTENTNSVSDTVVAPQESNDQICQDSYGTYSEWSGKLNSKEKPTCTCQTGYSWDSSGNSCAVQTTLQQECINSYGTGSYSYPQNGKAVCGCSSGYIWNSDQTACVVPQVTKDQQCQNSYGASNWTGELNGQGGPVCSCNTGYTWNYGQTQCVALSPDQVCQRDVGAGSSYLGYKNSDGTYACSSAY